LTQKSIIRSYYHDTIVYSPVNGQPDQAKGRGAYFMANSALNVDCDFYDIASTTAHVKLPLLQVPPDEPKASIAKLRKNSPDASALLSNCTDSCPLIRTELNVKSPNGGQLIFGLVDRVATFEFVS
jgi:hypothetical protein